MKITIFTGSSNRHKFLVNALTNHQIYLITENKKNFSFLKSKFFMKSAIERNYFKKVLISEKKIFGNVKLQNKKLVKKLKIEYKKLSCVSLKKLKAFLNSDLYIVFGSSLIKNNLINFLIKKKCLNIHMGISPYYRGSNCNFWAIIDKNYNLVGSTIHKLSKGIDDGPILYHSIVEHIKNPFDYSMASAKSAILSLKEKIDDKSIIKLKSSKQNIKDQIRLTKNSEFKSYLLKKYPKKIPFIKFNKKLLINPIMLKKSAIYDKNIQTLNSKKFKAFDNS